MMENKVQPKKDCSHEWEKGYDDNGVFPIYFRKCEKCGAFEKEDYNKWGWQSDKDIRR